jgi:hypothetical protein
MSYCPDVFINLITLLEIHKVFQKKALLTES